MSANRTTAFSKSISILFLLVLFACSSKKEITSIPHVPKPNWVSKRPITNMDYIGIGFSKKQDNLNFIESAKKNALSDLASEIKVNLQSSTVYKQNEVDGNYEDNFKSTTKTSYIANIEGYEIVDTWQDDSEYWVYYRLSKAKFERVLEERKSLAKKEAINHLEKASMNIASGKVKAAFQNYLDAYTAIQEYPSNAIEYGDSGKTVFLENKITYDLQSLFSEIQIRQTITPIRLEFNNHFSNNISLQVKYRDFTLENLTFNYQYDNKYGPVNQSIKTNSKGGFNIPVKATSLEKEEIVYSIILDLNSMIVNNENKDFLKNKLNPLIFPSLETKAVIIKPKVFISSIEMQFGKSLNKNVLRPIVLSELSEEEIIIVKNKSVADAVIKIESDTKLQSKDKDFTAVVLNYSYTIENMIGKTILIQNEGPFKGVSLDEARASDKAYEKAENHLKRSGILKIKSSILDF